MKLNLSGKMLVVHYDADVYSATLFGLFELDRLKIPYIAIFDEFAGHECLALQDYLSASGSKCQFTGKVMYESSKFAADQASCLITPANVYYP